MTRIYGGTIKPRYRSISEDSFRNESPRTRRSRERKYQITALQSEGGSGWNDYLHWYMEHSELYPARAKAHCPCRHVEGRPMEWFSREEAAADRPLSRWLLTPDMPSLKMWRAPPPVPTEDLGPPKAKARSWRKPSLSGQDTPLREPPARSYGPSLAGPPSSIKNFEPFTSHSSGPPLKIGQGGVDSPQWNMIALTPVRGDPPSLYRGPRQYLPHTMSGWLKFGSVALFIFMLLLIAIIMSAR